MKTRSSTPSRPILRLLAGALLAGTAASPSHATPPSGYTLVWADEFTGTSLDTTHWIYDHTGGYRNAINTPDAVTVSNGLLSIANYTGTDSKHYTGYIGTRFRYQPLYGYMEASIRFKDGPGAWSAFWMFDTNVGASNHPHTDGTEPDICEHRAVNSSNVDISNQVDSALHWDGYSPGKSVTSNPQLRGSGLGTGFHTYAMTWTPTAYTFYIDGSYVYTINNSTATDPVPPDAPVSQISEFFYLSTEILNGSWAGTIPAGGYGSQATSPYKMDVDYVRVYQQGPPTPPAPVNVTVKPGASGVTLNWNLTDNSPYYHVKRATVSGGPYTTLATTGIQTNNAAYLDTTAAAGQTYYYVVSGVNGPQEGPNSLEVSTSNTATPATAHTGTWAAKGIYNGTATYQYLMQTTSVVANTNYEAGLWLRGSGTIRVLVYPGAGGTAIGSLLMTATPAWAYRSFTFNTGANSQLRFKVDDESPVAGSVSVDDAFLGVSGGTSTLVNPGFESGASAWTISNAANWSIASYGLGNGNEHSGFQAARGVMSGSATYAYLIQTADVTANTTCEAGVWVKGGGKTRLLVYPDFSSPAIGSITIQPTATWNYYSFQFNTGSNTRIRVKIDDEAIAASTMYADDFFLGVPGGANVLVNPDFERGSTGWDTNYVGSVWTVSQW